MDKIKCLFPEEKNVDIVAIYPLAAEKGTLFITNSVNDVRAACLNDYYTLSTPTPLTAPFLRWILFFTKCLKIRVAHQ